MRKKFWVSLKSITEPMIRFLLQLSKLNEVKEFWKLQVLKKRKGRQKQ